MDLENEVITNETTEQKIETGAVEGSQSEVQSASTPEKVEQGAGAVTEPEYSPTFKFKVKDKELEFDDFLKPAIKNKETESKLKELYEKAHGLDEVKTSRESFKTQAEEWKTKYSTVETSLEKLGTYVNKKDFNSFFQSLNIPKEEILRYAINELKFQELPPEQRHEIEMQRQRELALEQSSQQNQTLQQQMSQMVVQQTEFQMNQELASPEVSSVAAMFDAKAGQQGAFRNEVIKRGQYYEAVHKISPPVSQLVKEILTLVGMPPQATQGTQDISQVASGQTPTNIKKPVIPSFQGNSASSPVRKTPMSTDDLRKMRDAL